jgi:hypothetical protein
MKSLFEGKIFLCVVGDLFSKFLLLFLLFPTNIFYLVNFNLIFSKEITGNNLSRCWELRFFNSGSSNLFVLCIHRKVWCVKKLPYT